MGAFIGAAAVSSAAFLALVDGSLLARLGRSIENDAGDELRNTAGLYGVVSAVPFDRFDVDHVILAPKGCFAVEVKALFGRRESLAHTYGLAHKLS